MILHPDSGYKQAHAQLVCIRPSFPHREESRDEATVSHVSCMDVIPYLYEHLDIGKKGLSSESVHS